MLSSYSLASGASAASFLTAALVTFAASSAAAQGTMTPSQPPADNAGTPTQPPPAVAPAQPAAVVAPAPAYQTPTEPPVEEHLDAPKARTGFQLALRTGVSIPLGKVQEGEDVSDAFSPQVPLIVDIGGKIIPQLFLGAYLGIAFGGAAGQFSDACDRANLSCVAVGFRIGAQIQYHILPAAKLNPWIGYGIGYEAVALAGSRDDNNKFSAALGGVEYAHLMAGLDFRVSRGFGIGPFADFAIGEYSKSTIETTTNGQTTKQDGDLANTALHQWLTLGAKFTFFP